MTKRQIIFIIICIIIIAFLIFTYKYERSFYVNVGNLIESVREAVSGSEKIETNISPISGLPCDNYQRRPLAVMLANDNAARPLSGISQADIVFEMQVVEDSITRLMAVFVCGDPGEIGSIRSARHSFIPLAMGLDAIYAHWGGSHFALEKLNKGIMDNIDAMPNPFEAFYRKLGIYAPHNGFSSISRLKNSAEKLGYRMENQFAGYLHEKSKQLTINSKQGGDLRINYTSPYDVEYKYDSGKNSYLRFRGGKAEMDKNNNQQVEAKVVAIMRANSRPLEGQYNDVDVEGEGKLTVYQNGEKISGTWRKDKANPASKLYFLDESGQEIKFIPGQIWVEIIEPGKKVSWLATSD